MAGPFEIGKNILIGLIQQHFNIPTSTPMPCAFHLRECPMDRLVASVKSPCKSQ